MKGQELGEQVEAEQATTKVLFNHRVGTRIFQESRSARARPPAFAERGRPTGLKDLVDHGPHTLR